MQALERAGEARWVQPCTLEGRYVQLLPLSLEHLEDLCRVGLDPELWRWSVSQVRTPAQMRAYIETALRDSEEGTALPFAIIDRSSGSAVGSTRYANIDAQHRRLEIGWTWLGRAWQRTPRNTEAKYLLLCHGFESLGCVRVEFKTDTLNERSRQALRRIGAREEGTLRKHMLTASGRARDSVYYSIVDEDWPTVKGALERKLTPDTAAGEPAVPSDEAPVSSDVPIVSLAGAPGEVRWERRRRRLPAGFELDDDRDRIDREAVHRFLCNESYWARGRSRESVERLLREASRVVGLYLNDRQVGFARIVSDGMAFAYLADVYVLPELRGRGLGLELVREAVEGGPYADRRWLLHTADAHGLYERVGFGKPSVRLMERPSSAESP
jgi:RimJ/RimL family protein N-acetyltransferase/ribosomal protein S18 acetylase RimI-like enzyme